MTAGAPGLLTCSTDKVIKLWDLNDGKPNLLSQHQPQVGAIFACGFSPSVPYLIAAAGSKGMVAVWDIMSSLPCASPRKDFRAILSSQINTLLCQYNIKNSYVDLQHTVASYNLFTRKLRSLVAKESQTSVEVFAPSRERLD